MTRYYSLLEANERLTELEPILATLRDQRQELIRIRDRVLASTDGDALPDDDGPDELPLLRLRMQGLIDQMQAGVARIDEVGVTLRDIETGLIDFAALVSGRPIWLCWRLGEGEIDWWHDHATGFEGRRRLADLA